ncbi:hypothetical protein GGD55_005497 [Rhizobium giardinii]|uniref:Uncharacterized protein n=1 Tax=Rhizobium giardinii TaxID=56731 RepID=A0A7W8XBF9_9HYPH|nr:hypothetical protein [Rhizobium giardinii]
MDVPILTETDFENGDIQRDERGALGYSTPVRVGKKFAF